MKTSNLFSLNWADFGKGLIVAVVGAGLAAVQASLSAGSLTFDWKAIGTTALAAGIAYLTKNFFTPASIVSPASSK